MQNIFKNLIKTYDTWSTLKAYLESEEGGLFRVIDKNDNLCIIRYQKNVSNMTLPHSNWFRSVVWDTDKNRPVCVAPPKTTNSSFPYITLHDAKHAGIQCQEQLDGFMINCFKIDGKLYCTSRSKLDASGTFYSNKPFRQLFAESFFHYRFDTNKEMEDSLQTYSDWMEVPKENEVSVFYSFLVQHKEHRIVSPVEKNEVYFIHKGIVYEDGTIEYCVNVDVPVQQIPCIPLDDSNVNFVDWVKNNLVDKLWIVKGFVCKDRNGNRWRFQNDKYAVVKSLRGNSASDLDRYVQLYTQNITYKYLEYFPEETFYFSCYKVFMNNIIIILFKYYTQIYITKEISLNDAEKMYIPHLYSLHGIYVTSLRSEGKKMNTIFIQQYFLKQPWQRIAFLIRENQNAYFSQIEQMVTHA